MSTQSAGFWGDIFEVASGRGQFRLIVQPLVAIILGARLGIADAKEGKDPFLLRLFRTSKDRWRLAKHAASDVMVPFIVAITMDAILQYVALGYVRPVAALVVGAALIWLPFSISRALVGRIYGHTARRHAGPTPTS